MTDQSLKIRLSKIEGKLNELLERLNPQSCKLLTIGAAAQRLGITTNALRERARRGTINSVYKNKHYYFEENYINNLPKNK